MDRFRCRWRLVVVLWPPEAFIALGENTYLAIFFALGTAFTVFIISYTCSRIIEHFPSGGGGYIVATHTISGITTVIMPVRAEK